MPFARDILVRFPDVDYARVVYYPRFFDYCHQVFEDFFAAEVGVPYAQMLTQRKVGYPSVHAESDFIAPLRFGDVATIEMTTVNVGQSSLTLRYRVLKAGALCARLEVVSAAVDMDTFQGVNVPDDVRVAFERLA